MRPSQKAGIDWPSTANTRALMSMIPPRRTAEYMPSGTPISTERNIATKPSSTVAGSRSQMCSTTGRREMIELPKSPMTTLAT
jgi:hypothetical protein